MSVFEFKETRSKDLKLRVSEKELNSIKQLAKNYDLSVSDLIRFSLLRLENELLEKES